MDNKHNSLNLAAKMCSDIFAPNEGYCLYMEKLEQLTTHGQVERKETEKLFSFPARFRNHYSVISHLAKNIISNEHP